MEKLVKWKNQKIWLNRKMVKEKNWLNRKKWLNLKIGKTVSMENLVN